MFGLTQHKNPKSQNIKLLLKTIKQALECGNVDIQESMFMHQYLVGGSFCLNYCISVAWHGGNQPVAWLRCYGSRGCFDSCLQPISIVGSGVFHLPLKIKSPVSQNIVGKVVLKILIDTLHKEVKGGKATEGHC